MSSRASPFRSMPATGASPAVITRKLVKLLYGRRPGSLLTPVLVLWLLHLLLHAICLWLGCEHNPGPIVRLAIARLALYLILPAAWWQIALCAKLGRKTCHALSTALVLAEGLLLLVTAKTLAASCQAYLPLLGKLVAWLAKAAGRLTL